MTTAGGLPVVCARDLTYGTWILYTGEYSLPLRVSSDPRPAGGPYTWVPLIGGHATGRPIVSPFRAQLWDGTPYAAFTVDGTCETRRWRCTRTRLCLPHQEELRAAQAVIAAGGERDGRSAAFSTRLQRI